MRFGIEIEVKSPHGRNTSIVAEAIQAKGVNCEAEGYNHRLRSHWKVVTDASVSNGVEIVSPPLTEEQNHEVELVCQALQELGCTIRRDCGLHVHHDARDLNLDHFKNVSKLWIRFERAVDEVMPLSRRANTNQYCRTNKTASLDTQFKRINQATTIHNLIDVVNYTRYQKLNLTSYLRHGTIEFRQHSGTIEADKILNWVALTNGIIETAKKYKRVNNLGEGEFKHLLNMAPTAKVKKFYTERRVALS